MQRLPARTFIPLRAASRKRPLRGSGDRSQDGGGGTGLNVTHRLGHTVNACLFRHLRAGGGFELSAEAELQTHALQDLLLELEKRRLPMDSRSPAGA